MGLSVLAFSVKESFAFPYVGLAAIYVLMARARAVGWTWGAGGAAGAVFCGVCGAVAESGGVRRAASAGADVVRGEYSVQQQGAAASAAVRSVRAVAGGSLLAALASGA
ncbi:MAG: hypothetical protein R3F14_17720 [Polyangiaceae bacterium]